MNKANHLAQFLHNDQSFDTLKYFAGDWFFLCETPLIFAPSIDKSWLLAPKMLTTEAEAMAVMQEIQDKGIAFIVTHEMTHFFTMSALVPFYLGIWVKALSFFDLWEYAALRKQEINVPDKTLCPSLSATSPLEKYSWDFGTFHGPHDITIDLYGMFELLAIDCCLANAGRLMRIPIPPTLKQYLNNYRTAPKEIKSLMFLTLLRQGRAARFLKTIDDYCEETMKMLGTQDGAEIIGKDPHRQAVLLLCNITLKDGRRYFDHVLRVNFPIPMFRALSHSLNYHSFMLAKKEIDVIFSSENFEKAHKAYNDLLKKVSAKSLEIMEMATHFIWASKSELNLAVDRHNIVIHSCNALMNASIPYWDKDGTDECVCDILKTYCDKRQAQKLRGLPPLPKIIGRMVCDHIVLNTYPDYNNPPDFPYATESHKSLGVPIVLADGSLANELFDMDTLGEAIDWNEAIEHLALTGLPSPHSGAGTQKAKAEIIDQVAMWLCFMYFSKIVKWINQGGRLICPLEDVFYTYLKDKESARKAHDRLCREMFPELDFDGNEYAIEINIGDTIDVDKIPNGCLFWRLFGYIFAGRTVRVKG